jgi:hypothetical protein
MLYEGTTLPIYMTYLHSLPKVNEWSLRYLAGVPGNKKVVDHDYFSTSPTSLPTSTWPGQRKVLNRESNNRCAIKRTLGSQ